MTLSQQARLSVIPGLAKDKRSFPLTFTARQQCSQKLILSFAVLCSLLPLFLDPIPSFDLSSMPVFNKLKILLMPWFPLSSSDSLQVCSGAALPGGDAMCSLEGGLGSLQAVGSALSAFDLFLPHGREQCTVIHVTKCY